MTFDFTPEQESFRQSAEAFARQHVAPAAAAIDESGRFPRDLVRLAGAHGLMGTTIPPAWGGGGRDSVGYALGIEAIAHASATLAVILVVNNSLVAEVIHRFGSEPQKERWLGRLASGEAVGSFALSEENAGSDAQNQQTIATPAATSSGGGAYLLNGRKVWVANAEAAEIAILFAATALRTGERGITAFLVPLHAPGVTRVARADSLGVRGLGCFDLELKDVRVAGDQILGRRDEGFKIAMWALDGGRVAIAAQALGVGRAALDEALAHARRRRTFGRAIGSYQAVQWMLADIATELEAARMLTLKAAAAKDTEERSSVEAAMAKLYASEAAHRAADRAMQILASAGYRRGSVVERLFRDARATEIYQGTSEVQRMVLAEHMLGARR